MQEVPNPPVRRRIPLGAAIGAAAVLAVILLIVFFQWNWLRGPLAGEISARLHRPVRIAGNLKVHPWSGSPWATLDDVRIGNPAWAGGGTMASAPRLVVRWKWGPLLAGKADLPLVWAQSPTVRLVSDANGRQNWNFSGRKTLGRPAPSPIEHLVITDGRVSYADAKARVNFAGAISTNETKGGETRAGAGISTLQGALTVGGAAWAGPTPMARITRLTIQARLLTAMAGKLELTLVEADGGAVRLVSDAAGRDNWRTDPKPKPLKVPPIDRLVIRNAALSYVSARQRVNFVGAISGDERGPAAGLSTIRGALTVGAAPWAGPAPLARAPSFVVQLKLLPLMAGGKLVLPLVEADRPSVRLVKDVSGRTSWQVSPSGTSKPVKLPTINNLIISNGALRYDDAMAKTHFAGTVSTSQSVNRNGRGTFVLNGKGVLNAAPFVAKVTGGALVNVDASRPYPFDAQVVAGSTKLAVNGIIAHPFDFGQMSGRLSVSGPDFSDLYHLTGVALPNTPPYQLAAGFAVAGKTYAFRGIGGRMGDSDLAGSLSVDDTNGRPFVTADLSSRRLKLA
ncbi:MAG: AsmA family protein, partial [Pseudomonadota bacterium]|nr:AsmA family protein [Pseudomonadota bacterium]